MSKDSFSSLEEALMVLSDQSNPRWGVAFAFLSDHPETAEMMIDTFSDVLEQMGVEPSGIDPATGTPSYSLEDVARAVGLPESDLDDGSAPSPDERR